MSELIKFRATSVKDYGNNAVMIIADVDGEQQEFPLGFCFYHPHQVEAEIAALKTALSRAIAYLENTDMTTAQAKTLGILRRALENKQ